MKDKITENIFKKMGELGYKEVTKEFYHKNKRKMVHGVWRIGKEYYYFIKFAKDNKQGAKQK